MKALSRKCTAFLLSLTLLLTLAPTALASEALGDDLDLRSTTLNRGAELGEGTFWSNTFSDLRQENYVVYTPNTSVTPIVTYGDYTTATSTVSAAAKRLEEQGLRVVAGINGDYYDTLNGAPLGTVMTDGVLRVASASNYAVGFRADGTAILGAPALAMQVKSANTSFSIAAVNQVRYSYGGIYLYTYDFNARRSTGTNAAVSFLKASGVTTGDDLGNFNPDSPITRQEFAVLLCRWLAPAQDTSSVELPFADSNRIADWAKDGVRAMYALGVTKGSYDGYGRLCFLPTATISRQEALTMLGRLLELGYAAPEWSFTDSDAIADWARGHINTLCAIGALSGYADGGIHPTEPITRAQVAATLFSMT